MSKLTAPTLILASLLPALVQAEPINLRCSYTSVVYNASYMKEPETRQCPQGRCYYDVQFDSETGSASVNGKLGYSLSVTDNQYVLDFQEPNPIVDGYNRARFVVNMDDMSYTSSKATPPDVTLGTSGQCQPLQ